MRVFLHESLQLFYYAYFRPSALQAQMDKAGVQQGGNPTFQQILRDLRKSHRARRFLAQCAFWWLLGLPLFGWLAWETMPLEGIAAIGGGLVLAAGLVAVWDLPLSLAVPLLGGLVASLRPGMWRALQSDLIPWLNEPYWGFVASVLILGSTLGGWTAIWVVIQERRELAPWLACLMTFLPVVITGIVVSKMAIVVTLSIIGVVTSIMIAIVTDEDETLGIAAVVVFGLVFSVAFGTLLVAVVQDEADFVVRIGELFRAIGVAMTVAFAAAVIIIVRLRKEHDKGVFTVVMTGGITSGIAVGLSAIMMFVGRGNVLSIATSMVAGGVAGVVATVVASFISNRVAAEVGDDPIVRAVIFVIVFILLFVTMYVVAVGTIGILAFLVSVGMVFGAVGRVTQSLIPVLSFGFVLGMALSSRRSIWLGLQGALFVLLLFAWLQGWSRAGLAALCFLVGYFRLLIYPFIMLSLTIVVYRSSLGIKGMNSLLHSIPPFVDEIVWLPLLGLDTLLVAGVEEDQDEGNRAIEYVANSFRQAWAARAARVRWSARAMIRYQTVQQVVDAPETLAWLSKEPKSPNHSMIEVERLVGEIAKGVTTALNATSSPRRVRGFNQVQARIGELGKFCTPLKWYDRAHCFSDVAVHWSDMIVREIKSIIPDPYIVGIPVQPDQPTMFAPRPDLVRDIEHALSVLHDKPTLALYGPRRMGKTTFLLHLSRLLPGTTLPVFVDMQEMQVSSTGEMYYRWASTAHKTAQKRHDWSLPRPLWEDFQSKQATAWAEWLDDVEQILGERKLFFTFDEFEKLVDAVEKNPELEQIFNILRNVIQHRLGIYLLFAGAHRLEELAPSGRWHDYFINVSGIEVTYLDEPDARRLITEPTPDFPVNISPGITDEVLHLTRCQPMLVQRMGHRLVTWLNSAGRRQQGDWLTPTMQDVDHAASEVLQDARGYFINLWQDAGKEGQLVLKATAQTPHGLALSELVEETGLQKEPLSVVLYRLQQYQLVELIEDRWRIQVELTRRAFTEMRPGL